MQITAIFDSLVESANYAVSILAVACVAHVEAAFAKPGAALLYTLA